MDTNSKYTDSVEQLPDYLDGAEVTTIHAWRAWKAMSKKIEEYPDRIYMVANERTGAIREFDCNCNVGVLKKAVVNFNTPSQDIDNMLRISTELQLLKVKKANFNKIWTKEVYHNKRGDAGLLSVRGSEIIELLGKFYTLEEVVKIVNNKWDSTIHFDSVRKFAVENKLKIDRKKADYILNSKELRLATDAGRLEVLSMLAYEMQVKFEKGRNIEVSKELRAIIEQIRKEVKGDEIKLTIDGRIDINATMQANLTLAEFLHKLPINMIVIGLTAAKQGLNPAHLIASLGNSYYSKYNGFNALNDPKEIQLPGQYIKAYNWDEIKHNKEEIRVIEDIEAYEESIPETVKLVTKTKKQELMELLEKYKQQTAK
jgi:hypothetical protein